ncbi:MAG: MEDS domain-containing protein [Actinomycetota bacterium]|nr:MEDS domain-containing protein [Actinomycetota bacterium]
MDNGEAEMESADEDMLRLQERLCEQAGLLDDPDTYAAGVEDALAAAVGLSRMQSEPVRDLLAAESSPHRHLVEFYESEKFLADSVVEFLAPVLGAGEAVIIIATREHRDKFELALIEEGVDVAGARQSARLVALDAAEMLAGVMVDGAPDPARFRTVVGGLIDRVADRASGVRIYGEMVALLCEDAEMPAAVEIEELWNELAEWQRFSLLCAYPLAVFDRQDTTAAFRTICQQHSAVIPTESYSTLSEPEDRLRAVALLQQEASAGTHELRRRHNQVQAALDRLRELDRLQDRLQTEFVITRVHDLHIEAEIIGEIADLLRESWSKLDEDDIQELLTKTIENVNQIERLAGDLLLTLWPS